MLEGLIQKYSKQLEEINYLSMRALEDENGYIQKVLSDYSKARGKQLRPLITLILADNFPTCDKSKVCELASIYERIHIASLIHDDVIDHCSYRRHKKTLNEEFGNEVAILLGDYIFANIFYSSAKYGQSFVESVAMTISNLTKGELKQQEFIALERQTLTNYLEIISKKTSALLELTFGQTLRQLEQPDELISCSQKLAKYFGQIFQIVDDWYDFCLFNQGKNFGSDRKNGFITLPWILLYQNVDELNKKKLVELWQSSGNDYFSSPFLQEILKKYDLLALMRKEIFKLYARVQSLLVNLSPKISYQELQSLVDNSVRKFEKTNLVL